MRDVIFNLNSNVRKFKGFRLVAFFAKLSEFSEHMNLTLKMHCYIES